MNTSTSVLIVGGGLVGSSAAMLLAHYGVPTIVIERHPGSSLHPRAVGYTPRTLEIYRAVGLTPKIPQAPPDFRLRRVKVDCLAGKWEDETTWTPTQTNNKTDNAAPTSSTQPATTTQPKFSFSPNTGAAIAQDRLEPLLRDTAIELGADMRMNTELITFKQDSDGITASVRERTSGKEYNIRAEYMIAADGHRSSVREALGITRSGRGHMRTVRSVLFRAALEEYTASGVSQFNVRQPDLEAFLATYNDGRWVLIFSDDDQRDPEALKSLIFKAIGRSDIEVEIITDGRWEMAAWIADTFQSGRIFLAGDAAHQLPPNRGGYGANTGIDDAHNIAWKLAAVIAGTSTPALLDTYDAERRPIALLRHSQIFARSDYTAFAGNTADVSKVIDDAAMEFGQLYRSTAVIGASNDLPPAKRPDEWNGQAGTRAPHAWIKRGDQRLSTIDLFPKQWTLIIHDDNEQWQFAATKAAERFHVKVEAIRIGTDIQVDDQKATTGIDLAAAFGLKKGGASLVRPDGYIAWTADQVPTDKDSALIDALKRVSSATY